MCAIGGIVKLDKRKTFDTETQLDVVSLLREMEARGSQSWGAYVEKHKETPHLNCGIEDSSLVGEIFKLPGRVTDFFDENDGIIYLDGTHTILMHTRQATHGSSDDNKNNHPFNTQNFILSHNGIINNSKELATKYNIETNIECDSYMIVALIQHFYNQGVSVKDAILSALDEITGGFACWLYHKDKKDLYLFRNSRNPLEYYIDEERGILIFASEDDYITKTYGDGKLNLSMVESLPFNEVYKLQSNELVKLADFKSNTTTTYSGYECCNGYTSSINVDDYDKLMAKLFLFLTKFDTTKYQHILAATDNSAFLLVRRTCEPLIKLLDENGFKLYKRDQASFDWIRYITSKSNMENLTKSFLDAVSNPPLLETKTTTLTYTEDELVSNLRDFAKSSNIVFSCVGNLFVFTLTDRTPSYVLKLFKKNGGYKFAKKGNTLRLKSSNYHKKNLEAIIDDYLDDALI